jgi:SecD/SecF fusion protein
MQNKSAVLIFTVLLALATLYTLSFNYFSSQFENEAQVQGVYEAEQLLDAGQITDAQFDATAAKEAKDFLRAKGDSAIVPVIGKTYREAKERELNLGLDLRGGMSVTLEVSIPDLVIALADYSTNEQFRAAVDQAKADRRNSNADFITLFGQAWAAQGGDVELWRIFHNMENRDLFPQKSTDDEILAILRAEAETAINNTENIIRKRIDQLGVAQPNVQKLSFSGRILVELPGIDDPARARKQLKSTANLEFWETWFNEEVAQRIADANVAAGQALSPDLYAEEAPADSALTTDQLRAKNPLFAVLQPERTARTSIVGYSVQADTGKVNDILAMSAVKAALGNDVRLLWSAKSNGNVSTLYAIQDQSGRGKAKLDGKSIVDARVGYDEIGDVVCNMTMNGEGAGIWGQMTKAAAADNNRAVAVVLDNLVFSAPNVNSPILNGRSQISFGTGQTAEQKLQEAEDLSSLLKAGSLPAPARIVDEVSVGPQLGEDNIRAGLSSFVFALLVVLVYMIFYYRGAGVVSNIALIANLFFLIGALASLGAALTLPGIAGIVLTIGMAVDANVLIYERVREEMRAGKGLTGAVQEGYSKAYSAIIDANITTLLTAIILYSFGSGAIRGFATTLMVGIFTSLFSAIVLTRLVFFTRMENKKGMSFSSKMTENWFTNTAVPFIARRRLAYIASALVIAGGFASLSTKGLNYGVEFTGGSTFDVTFEQPVDMEVLRGSLSAAFTEDGTPGNPIVQTKESERKVRIMTNYMIDSEAENQDEQIQGALKSGLESAGAAGYTIDRYNKVDGTISDDFRRGATNATVFSLIVIFLYIFIRFRKWQYGLGALVAMVHDVLIVLSLFSIFWGILPFTMEIDQAFIAAILTVIGYSINDTVVVFDRIREYFGLYGTKKDRKEVFNLALNSTLSRTINTSLSTFVVLLTIFLFGGDNIKGFVFALMVGVVVGTYSSIFIATPTVVDLSRDTAKA